ncbi:unnamed protein product [Lepidochelys olivacea]
MLLFMVFLVLYILNLLGNLAIIVQPLFPGPLLSCTIPQMLVNFRSAHKSISWAGCVAQLYVFLSLGCTECLPLAVMADDRYVAIGQPLRYTIIMSRRLCLQMAATIWLSGFGNSMLQVILTMRLPRCGRNRVDHFF